MVRRTKQEAQQTRCDILAAARRCFHERGVSATSLEHIAQEAGVTRGAIYWHFENKEQLFQAMREEVELPLIDRTDFALLRDPDSPPLERLRHFLLELADAVAEQVPLRQTFEIMSFKCEYVGPLGQDLAQHMSEMQQCREKLQRVYQEAQRAGALRAGLKPRLAATETLCFIIGLLRTWLADDAGVLVRKDMRALIDAHVDTRRPAPMSAD